MPYFFKIPKVQLALVLLLIASSALILDPDISNVKIIITSLVATVLFDVFFTYIKSRQLFIPYAAIVTGLIIGLIIDPNATIFQVLVITSIAMATKNFLRLFDRHIFNPAASGLVLGGIILNLPVAWWGVSLQNIDQLNIVKTVAFLTIVLSAYVSILRFKRYKAILSFLIFYTVIIVIPQLPNSTFSLNSLTQTILNPSILFFSLIMLPEPMTSPVNFKNQIFYGASVAILTYLLSIFFFSNTLTADFFNILLIDPILIPLLIANLAFFKFRL